MNVGILTFHDGINYGAYLQVYALRKLLTHEGFECRVINYKSPAFTFREYRCFLDLRHVPLMDVIRNMIRITRFKKAHRKLNFTKRIFSGKNLSSLYFDRVVIGSDEVWNFTTDLIGYDPVYFSKGIKAGRILSYAASFGSAKAGGVPEELRELLGKIEFVSVRDDNSRQIMKGVTGRTVPVVLDPTFLVDLGPEAVRPAGEDYILVYGSFNAEMIRKISNYAASVGKKTVAVGYRLPWCDENRDTLDPFEWLGYFANCDSVITSMYHGMIFSILNRKEFCMFSTPYRRNKVGTLLSDLGIPERLLEEGGSLSDTFSRRIDYARVDGLIEARRRDSKDFLLGALRAKT